MSKTTGHYEDTELAAFAMQLPDLEEHEATAEHVRDCVFCRQELARLHGDLAACAYGVEMFAPASSVRERLMHRVGREKKAALPPLVDEVSSAAHAAPIPEEQTTVEPTLEFRRRSADAEDEPRLQFRSRGVESERESAPGPRRRRSEDVGAPAARSAEVARGVFGWLGWAVAACFAITGVRLYQQQTDYRTKLSVQAAQVNELRAEATDSKRLMDLMSDPSAQRVLLSPPEGSSGSTAEGHVIYDADKGSLILLANHLAPLAVDKTYELWLIPADGSNPVPAGTFHPDAQGNGNIILPSLPRALAVKAFGITLEDGTGSQTPTMPIVLAGS